MYGPIKPEYVINKAEKLIADNKKQFALDYLHSAIRPPGGRKPRYVWEQNVEDLMLLHLKLCVELDRIDMAKDALWSYRNIVQTTNANSLEFVISKYLKECRRKLDEVLNKSQTIDDVDLDDAESPEMLLLKAVATTTQKERSKDEKTMPALRFLWDSYKNCIELLRNNGTLHDQYQKLSRDAMDICIEFGRRQEFRRLCDTMRNHFSFIQKCQHIFTFHVKVRLDDKAVLDSILNTRFYQLEAATKLEMWTEAYKTAEDLSYICDLMSKYTPIVIRLKIKFYEKLSKIFFMCGNSLYHAATLLKIYQMYQMYRQKEDAKSKECLANRCVLAVLSLGPWSEERSDIAQLNDWENDFLNKQMALKKLVNLQQAPTSSSLKADLTRHQIIDNSSGFIKDLLKLINNSINPLSLCSEVEHRMSEHFDVCKEYFDSIKNTMKMRALQQVMFLYKSVAITRLAKILCDTPQNVEKFLLAAARKLYVNAKINHMNGQAIANFIDSSFNDLQSEIDEQAVGYMPFDAHVKASAYTYLMHDLSLVHGKLINIHAYMFSQDYDIAEEQLKRSMKIANDCAVFDNKQNRIRMSIIDKARALRLQQQQRIEKEKQKRDELKRAAENKLRNEVLSKKELKLKEELRIAKEELTRQTRLGIKIVELNRTSIGQDIIRQYDQEEILTVDIKDLLNKHRHKIIQQALARNLQVERKHAYLVRACHLEEVPIRKKVNEQYMKDRAEHNTMMYEARVARSKAEYEQQLVDFASKSKIMDCVAEFVDSRRCNREEQNKNLRAAYEQKRADILAQRLTLEQNRRVKEAYEQYKFELEIKKKEEEDKNIYAKSQKSLEPRNELVVKPQISKAEQDNDWRNSRVPQLQKSLEPQNDQANNVPLLNVEKDNDWRGNLMKQPPQPVQKYVPIMQQDIGFNREKFGTAQPLRTSFEITRESFAEKQHTTLMAPPVQVAPTPIKPAVSGTGKYIPPRIRKQMELEEAAAKTRQLPEPDKKNKFFGLEEEQA